jgi:hypothetical protein
MARRRQDRWLLLRLAAQNVGRRRWRTVLLGLSVMLGVGVGFAAFVAGWVLRTGMTANLSRMGADLVVVPKGTLVNITASLLTVQPTEQTLDTASLSGWQRLPASRTSHRSALSRCWSTVGPPMSLPLIPRAISPWIAGSMSGPRDHSRPIA